MERSELVKTVEVLRLRNTQLRMQQTVAELEVRSLRDESRSLRTECANWKQIALAAVAKAKALEQ